MSIREQLLSKAKKLPESSGVYLFVNANGAVLYVGKATSLRRRVSSYFQKNLDPRISEMVSLAQDIKFRKTENVLEALILEANLIKKYWPKYNIKEKDNTSFAYIVIAKTDWPKPFIVRGNELQKLPLNSHVFGPYQSARIAKQALKIIRQIFPYSACRPLSGKPCFEYQIGICPGACVGEISKKDYQKNIRNIILFLSGRKKQLLKKLQKENPGQAQNLKYIQDVALISRDELIPRVPFYRIEGYDISHFAGKETYGSMVVSTEGEANKNEYRLFRIKTAPANDDLRALEEMISRRLNHPEWPFPDLILLDGGKPQVLFISKLLKEKNLNIPLIGISKLQKDKLIFPVGANKNFKELAEAAKPILLRLRDEAHRFALQSSKKRRKIFKGKSGKTIDLP